ncbi:MAG TPA: hypothetical protein VM778_14070, partial [Gemmatimonadota bacterium]|nr:hypothetical protein [Gemmatimonadota bacterium]
MNRRMLVICCAGLLVQVAACEPASTPESRVEADGAGSVTTQEVDWNTVDAAMGRCMLIGWGAQRQEASRFYKITRTGVG